MAAAENPPPSQESPTLPQAVAEALRVGGLTVSTAESCTGGLIAKQLTDIAGSSAYFVGGIVAYANRAKTRLLGVPDGLLEGHGAVSAEVAGAMAEGCRRACGSDYAVAVTGVAGPGGGSAEKPVGLVYVGVAARAKTVVHELRLDARLGRAGIREATARAALQVVLEALRT